ncbi:hypothetical protein BH10CYA1_BH10CYA1_09660 [soil metagenome]
MYRNIIVDSDAIVHLYKQSPRKVDDKDMAEENSETLSHPSHLNPQVGQLVGERYRLLLEIGQGGMGVVYKAEQIFLQKICALKILKGGELSSTKLARFHNEAKAASRLSHRNVVSVTDFGVWHDSTPYFVMDYFEGITLQEQISKHGALAVDETLEIFSQLCDGLAYAHEQGIVHRDIKPGNILLTLCEGEPIVRILDFGIAKIVNLQAPAQSLTTTGEVFGSPLYMSPEQCLGQTVDMRSDIYSLGCTIFELLTGAPPFEGANALSTMMMHQGQVPLTLREASLGCDFPEQIERIVAKMLVKDQNNRYQTVDAIKLDLERFRTGGALEVAIEPGANKSSKARTKLLIAFLTLALLATGVYLGPKLVGSTAAITPPQKLTNYMSVPEVFSTETSAPYFAQQPLVETKNESWRFVFPEQSIGDIQAGGHGKKLNARGEVTVTALPLSLRPSIYLCKHPNYFEHFRDDEIAVLDFNWNDEVEDQALLYIDHLKSLREIGLESTEITDKGLAYIKELPGLVKLDVSNTKGVTGEGLSRLKSLPLLTDLRAEVVPNARLYLPILAKSKKISVLSLTASKITDSDLDVVKRCTSLRDLYLSKNAKVTDAGVAKLVVMPELADLDLYGCSITKNCANSLKAISKLRLLSIDARRWTEDDLKALHAALPKVRIEYSEHIP